jgi:1,4-dihydroxy-2-naphthoate octaprenyltransferase
MGAFLAAFFDGFRWEISLLAAVTTLFLQILSNLANDLGDALKGTDNQHRIGPLRAVQSGKISAVAMRKAVILFVGLSLISGIVLIAKSIRGTDLEIGIGFFLLGIAAIAAAVFYTIGKKAYGYAGFGDFFVFVFFGLVAVIGTYFLNTLQFRWDILLPASSLGFLSAGVLNLNNLRDIENDKNSGKMTLAVKLGEKGAKYYHLFLISAAFLSALLFNPINTQNAWSLGWLVILLPLFVVDLIRIFKTQNLRLLDPFLKKLALKTLLFVLVYGVFLLVHQ